MVPETFAFPETVNVVLVLVPPAIVKPAVSAVGVNPLIVLFVNVSVPANVAIVPVVGKVTLLEPVVFNVTVFEILPVPTTVKVVPELVPPATENPAVSAVGVNPLIVLFVNVSVPANVAIVPDVGKVTLLEPVVFNVTVFEILPDPATVKVVLELVPPATENPAVSAVGVNPLIVLFVNVSVPANVAIVPIVGKVTLLEPVVFNVTVFEILPDPATVKVVLELVPPATEKPAVSAVGVNPLIVLFVNDWLPAIVA